jgi:hypothetical protein
MLCSARERRGWPHTHLAQQYLRLHAAERDIGQQIHERQSGDEQQRF